MAPRGELLSQQFSAPINITGVNSTYDHFHGPVPMTSGYSPPVVQQGEIPMDYSTEITGLYYAHQHSPLAHMQLQYEKQQYAIPYSLPYYSGERLATPTQPSGADTFIQLMPTELCSLDFYQFHSSMCFEKVQDLEKIDVERHM